MNTPIELRPARVRPAFAWALVLGLVIVAACADGPPSLGAVRVSLVTRTNDTFVADGEVTYEAASASDLVKQIECIVAPTESLPAEATVRDPGSVPAGSEVFEVPRQPDDITNGKLQFALDGRGAAGIYRVLCSAISETGKRSASDVRTAIVVP